MRRVESSRALAHAIALAFLDGEWQPAPMAMRAAHALLAGGRWLRELVHDVRIAFPRPPHHDVQQLTVSITEHKPFRLVWAQGWLEPGVHTWHTPAPQMAFTPWPVPPLPSVGDLARWLAVDVGTLTWLADVRGMERRSSEPRLQRYRYRWVEKRSGGKRLLEAPKGRLRTLQRRILDGILAHVPVHDAAHGFVPGRSPLTHAALHAGRAVVLRVDLRAFFTEVPPRVRALFRTAGYPEEVARTLTGLTTNRAPLEILVEGPYDVRQRLAARHLPQGAPTSPALANLCAFRLDARLAALAESVGATYSRYADDLTFSGDAPVAAAAGRLLRLAARVVEEEGFALNPRKTRVMRARGRQVVTGVVVNTRPNVARPELDRLKAMLTNCVRHGPASQARGEPRLRDVLRGKIAWVVQVHPTRGRKLLALFERIDWTR